MVDAHKELFERCKRDLTKADKADSVVQDLNQIGTLIDFPREKEETTLRIFTG